MAGRQGKALSKTKEGASIFETPSYVQLSANRSKTRKNTNKSSPTFRIYGYTMDMLWMIHG
ncbi:hypothetical protein CCY01nite_33950 [Chitinophaga cymbidii]|uniref:Uncharacterized protein n=1 Tax=Chitinophaga cymbidii TaxID=1096750 RepID=A0A512RN58_9BACT|nr:hypothetical protein CCY01nite_33950 [Chitinophaga cymbidii]